MKYAEAGYNLEIDLATGNIERVETDSKMMELHLGGQGTAAKILWDRVPPEVDAFSPDNLLIFSTGLLHGTPVIGANRTVVNTISPQTDRYSHSIFGGFFGPELKHAGYDKIVIQGKASSLVYLYINNDKVEIRDATHLQGKGASETAEMIQAELNDSRIQVAAIGLAGENRVYMASIEHGNSSASRGVGVIMGDKRLKAIAVRGTRDTNTAKPAELFQVCNRMVREIYDNPHAGDTMAHGEGDEFHVDNFAWGNARARRKNFWSKEREQAWVALEEKLRVRWTGCYNCPKDCHQAIKYPGRRPYFQKCYSKLTYAMAAMEDLEFDYDIIGLTQEYGLDAYSTPQVMAFAIELYEAGILTDDDLPDFPKDGAGRFFYLVEKIVRREGIGDVLANGVYHAARQIGKGAEVYDHNTMKKFEQVPIKLSMVNYPYFLMYATGEKMAINQIEGSFPQTPIADRAEREAYVAGWEAAPERFKKWLLEWEPRTHPTIEASVHICDWNETMHYVDDAIGTCAFLSSFRGQFGGRAPYHIYNLPELISLATGLSIDSDELWKIAARNRNLIRAINIRRGLRRADEAPPADHWKHRDPEAEKQLLDAYYEFKGWNYDGIPTAETLDKFELSYVKDDLIERRIIPNK
ncbi:Tungsten-containing aldehyde:ferredoxin oxidoreductase [Georgfuchsia toluolica]|uniref:Tungsten-containing aldehyde:ferredoxin oxidoreductase n=1 Tax=Georgfuchsia toluolica TaxID=424218 RepID=A0A916J2V9_9PROT|nr:aldehyde ferredoxin oxidoreductase N-terminal domain-containing protein [Georgfuchsia toluolica]CAG4882828.1 Tungsten-containing aldehyde:ferredoxin oxidoreductase [Georgfuchsia toluolica]